MVTQNSANSSEPVPQTNALDLIAKYSALLLGVTYASGFLAQEAFLLNAKLLSHSDVSFISSRLLVVGASVVVLCFIPTFFVLGIHFMYDPSFLPTTSRQPTKRARKIGSLVSRIVAPVMYAIVLGVFFYQERTVGRWDAVSIYVFVMMANLLGIWISLASAGTYSRLRSEQQFGLVAIIAACIFCVSLLMGQREWARATARENSIRLLIAPEAITGARQLGIAFPETKGSTSAQLSENLNLLYVGERMYLVRIKDGHIVQLSKDKVWGAEMGEEMKHSISKSPNTGGR